MTRFFDLFEKLILSAIVFATVFAVGEEVYKLILAQTVALTDLLLLFIYAEVVGMVAGVDAHGKQARGVAFTPTNLLDGGHQQAGGKVIDAVVTEILEDVECDGLPGAGESADDDQAQFAWHVISAPLISAS